MYTYIFHTAQLTTQQANLIEAQFKTTAQASDGFYSLRCGERPELTDIRQSLGIDVNVLPAGFKGDEVGLLVTDMDSTLISIECIDEIADMLGLKPQVSAITEAAMRGELDFEASLTQRVALLKGLPEEDLLRVYQQRLTLNPGAEQLVAYLKTASIKLALVSGGFTFFTEKLKQRLGIDYTLANTLDVVEGMLTGRVVGNIVGAQAKADLLLQLSEQLSLQRHQVIAMGDGANDLLMMQQAGLSVAYHAKPTVQAQTDCQLNQTGLNAVIDLLKA
ncbi:MAG: phosphoserine phosphatase SerB [Cycloclasticus sp.]|nr:phosphoserine phosphatase SerB [Cycloclasticus sp.]MBQ0789349.1 phosphoserine phosphatase SerB [Cycloclasticus sp.]